MSAPPASSTEAPAKSGGRPGLPRRARFLLELFSETAARFSRNEGYRLGAAFSYYATFSIFPLLLLSITLVGFVLGDSEPARERLLDAFTAPGSSARDVLDRTLAAMQASRSARGISAVVGVGTLLFGASGAFVELDAALNRIWCVPPRTTRGVVGSIRLFVLERLSGAAVVLTLGLTLLLSLIASSLIAHLAERAEARVPTALWPALARTADLTVSMTLLSLVFTAVFHLVPRSRPPVRLVAGSAVLTTVLLTVLKEGFASYLSDLASYSAYGVAGGVLALTAWIYLSSMVLLFGAQLARVRAEKLDGAEDLGAAAA